MNFKKSALASAITLATFATGAAAFDASSWEVSGFVKNETAFLQKDGTFNGQSTGPTDTTQYNDQGDVIKFENTLKLFVNGALGENADLHAELNFVADPEAKGSHFETHDDYSQTDYLRELYIDSVFGENSDVELRIGKQQVVWGTADGAKLLDIINPTDYREMAQNTMEDSRVPVWMAKLEMPAGENGSVQFIASQPRENIFAGLNRSISEGVRSNGAVTFGAAYSGDTVYAGHDKGNPFVLKGVDTITGQTNGFLNIVPDLGTVSRMFGMQFSPYGANNSTIALDPNTHGAMNYFTVGGFNHLTYTLGAANGSGGATTLAGQYAGMLAADATLQYGGSGTSNVDFTDLNFGNDPGYSASNTGAVALSGFAQPFATNLNNKTNASTEADSVFEYMDRTPFSTFDAFVDATSEYKFDMPDDLDADLALRYKNSLDNGLGYSVNYAYAYDKNPHLTIDWYTTSGEKLDVVRNTVAANSSIGVTDVEYAYLTLSNAGTTHTGTSVLRFTETLKRAHNLGAAFDYTVDTDKLGGVVLRGEFLYQKDVYSPVIDKGAMSIGDLPAALTMRKGDRFKYVLGADITVLTNMLVSGQFIQDRNLDHIDSDVDYNGASCSTVSSSTNCGVYTLDFASMHMTNGFKKAKENKEFYSLFLSKPFGPNQLGRWNNIFMYEEDGGKWNRFDVEYSFTDELVGTFELNNYWGDANTQFGQLEDASNVQVGFKYLF
jgi:hypothetical protein